MIGETFLKSALREFRDYKGLGDKTFAQLNEKDFHFQPNEECNNIAIIIQHMHGNMLSRWTNFLIEDGEKEWRNRDAEFEDHFFSNEECNNIAIIIQHMHGNMLSRWTNFLIEDGEKEWRNRDAEFEDHFFSKE